ncbi:MAG: flagellar FliJ family protein [Legionellales bacterium]|nr:flagellar FliJ family protein [Legionellales bacterium]
MKTDHKRKLERINKVIDLARRKEQEQAKVVQRIAKHYEQELQKLNQLRQYQADYTSPQARQKVNRSQIGMFQNYQAFVGKINSTIVSQEAKLTDIEQRLAKQRHILAKLNLKTASYQNHYQKQKQIIEQKIENHEQFLADELYSASRRNHKDR